MKSLAELDAVDHEILRMLQENARISNAEVARRVAMAPSAVLERIRKLEERGFVEGYHARLSARRLGRGLTAFIFVRGEDGGGALETARLLGAVEGVQEVHHVAGEDCFLVKIRVADTESLGRLLREEVGRIPSIRSTRTTVVLETVLETHELPLPGEAGDE